jgi:hypothetical protein
MKGRVDVEALLVATDILRVSFLSSLEHPTNGIQTCIQFRPSLEFNRERSQGADLYRGPPWEVHTTNVRSDGKESETSSYDEKG